MITVRAIDGLCPDPITGEGGFTEGYIRNIIGDLMEDDGGVRDRESGELFVSESSPPSMDVEVADGVVYVANSNYDPFLSDQIRFWDVAIKGEGPITISANTSGQTRYDLICVFVDKSILPENVNEYASNVASIVVVMGTPGAGIPAIPSDHQPLAAIEVVDSATSITNDDIADYRFQMRFRPSIFNSSLANSVIPRNYLVNSNFEIAQRGTSFTSTGYTLDRFYFERTNSTLSQQTTGAARGSSQFARVTLTGAGGQGEINQALESSDCLKLIGKSVTFSCLLRRSSGFVGNITIAIRKNSTANTQTGGAWSVMSSTPILNADIPDGTTDADWVRVGVSVAFVPDDGTANGIGIQIINDMPQSSDYYEVSQVQLVEGTSVSNYNPISISEEVINCWRFYETGVYGIRSSLSAGGVVGSNIQFRVLKRATPSLSVSGGSTSNVASETRDSISVNGFRLTVTATGSADTYIIDKAYQASSELA